MLFDTCIRLKIMLIKVCDARICVPGDQYTFCLKHRKYFKRVAGQVNNYMYVLYAWPKIVHDLKSYDVI